ncbi:TPA: hypothetical protein U1045_001546 [Streptococcus suis]|nr:hypothetical protein [Streptococcus suis]
MTRVSKQNAIKYLERKAYPGWDACSDSLAISLADAKHLIDLIYSQSEEEVLNETIYKKDDDPIFTESDDFSFDAGTPARK